MSAPVIDRPAPQRTKVSLLSRSPQDTPAGIHNYIFLIITLLVGFFPIWWMFIVSTGDDATLAKIPPQLTPGDNFMTNFNIVMGNIPDGTQSFAYAHFGASFLYSTIVTVTITVSTLFFCSLAGFAFSKLKFKGRDPLMVVVVLTLTIPNQLGVVALYIIISRFGWQGQLTALIVPALVSAFGVFYMRQFIQDALPDEIVESARMDGASTFRIFWTMCLPVIRPALGVLGLLTAVGAWNEFQWALIALGPGTENPTVGVALSKLASAQYPRPRISLAGSLLATIPLLVLLAVAGKQIVRGVMEGALKH
jgi:cellobiose transport system permease protein